MRSSRHSQHRFTCIEIMVPILVVGLLATIVIQSVRGASDKAKRIKAQADIAELILTARSNFLTLDLASRHEGRPTRVLERRVTRRGAIGISGREKRG